MNRIKRVIMAALILSVAHTYAQQSSPFTLIGHLTGSRVDSAILYYTNVEKKRLPYAVPVVNQTFTIKGTISEPQYAVVLFKTAGETKPRDCAFFLEPKAIMLNGDPAKTKEIKITGSKTQEEYEELNRSTAPILAERQPIMDELMKEKDHEKQAVIRQKLTPFDQRVRKVTYDFFLQHPNSYVTAYQIKYFISNLKLDSLKRVYDHFNAELKSSQDGRELGEEIKKIEAGMPGSLATIFSSTDIDGHPLALSDFKGKYVLVDFWASWCVPCRAGNPHMIEVYGKYHAKGLEIIGVSDDDRNHDAWKAAVAKDNVGIWHHVLRGLDMNLKLKGLSNPKDISELYGIHSLPTKILIDPAGKIIGRYGDVSGGTDQDLDQMIAKVLDK